MLKQETIEVEGVTYEVSELTLGEALPIMESDVKYLGFEMMKEAVTVNGEKLGEGVNELGFSTARELIRVVNRLNGLAGDDEGND